jgi:hypothetical protein
LEQIDDIAQGMRCGPLNVSSVAESFPGKSRGRLA